MSSLPKLLKLKDYVTLTGTVLGLIALVSATIGGREWVSMGFFLIAITLGTDLLDGYIARKTGTVNQMGKQLDSLSDSLTFGIAPAALTFQGFKTGTGYDLILLIGCILFALGAILRLARFNISDDPGYTGVPTPLSALLLITFFYANYFFAFAFGGGFPRVLTFPFLDIAYYAIPFLCGLIGWMNITTFIVFSEKGKFEYIIFCIFAPFCPLFGIIGILNPDFIVSMIACIFFIVGFLLLMGYIISGFYRFFKKRK